MSDSIFGVVELLLVFGVVLGLAIRELVVVRRDTARARMQSLQPDPGVTPNAAPGVIPNATPHEAAPSPPAPPPH